jgi:hypothetical protein
MTRPRPFALHLACWLLLAVLVGFNVALATGCGESRADVTDRVRADALRVTP